MKCSLTNKPIEEIMSFGQMPIANGFIDKENFKKEYFYEMTVGVSPDIGLFQLTNFPKVEMMFHENYSFFTNSSNYMKIHFENYAKSLIKKFINSQEEKIIEIGCNDGTMLENFKRNKIQSLGIDPSTNVTKVAKEKGLDVISSFFSENLARSLEDYKNKTKIICAANVICHIPDLKDLIKGVDILLDKKGVFVFEEPYLGSMLNNVSYDQIYDEHIYIFSAIAIEKIFNLFNFELIDLHPQITHGGSMRYTVARKNEYEKSTTVKKILDEELKKGFLDSDIYFQFKKNCLESKNNFTNLIKKISQDGKKLSGYAATSKSTTVLNFCSIGPNDMECIYDTTPEKIGKFSPGKHIPIIDSAKFKDKGAHTSVLFAWNHKKEIMNKESLFISSGGKWISHIKNIL